MIEITVITQGQPRKFLVANTPIAFGRHPGPEYPDLVLSDPFASRTHVELSDTTGGQLRVRCLGRSPIELPSGKTVEHDEESLVDLPAEIRVGRSRILLARTGPGISFLHAPTSRSFDKEEEPSVATSRFPIDEAVSPDRLIQWFESLVALQESLTGMEGLFRQASKAVVELIGLDRCMVLYRENDRWEVHAEHGHRGSSEIIFSRSVVEHVTNSKQTVFDSTVDLSGANSLAGVSAFVGSPITDISGEIVACLFGVRKLDDHSPSTGVLPIEAQLVQIIAGIVSMRISRLEAEAEQVRTQVQLEQFASPTLVREMQANPHWLDANQRELTLLFGDIRSFAHMTERLTVHQTFCLVRDVMDCMTEVIHRHGGFVINYAGDSIAAMWNAPEPSEHHARSACRAAVEIQERLPLAVGRWTQAVGAPIRVGLGINSGLALIGNSGSKHRLMYSPLGHAVNLASRVEGATKHLGVSILVTQATLDRVTETIVTRDLGEISVIGISGGVRVHEVATGSQCDANHWKAYERTLRLFENNKMDEARREGQRLLREFPDDVPTKVLMERIERSHAVASPWVLPNK